MSFLSKLFGKGGATTEQDKMPSAAATCPHTTLVPRWDNAADIGHEERATGYRCEGCGAMFTRAEAEALRRREAERLRETVAAPEQPEHQ